MKNIKLYALFKILSKEELKAAKKFLHSPYHNTDLHLPKLFDYLCKYYPKMESQLLKPQALSQFMFPHEEYNEKKIRSLRHKLTQVLESFLIVHSLQSKPATSRRLLIETFQQRKALSLAEKEIVSQIKRTQKEDGQGGIEYHQEMAWLNRQLYFHPSTDRFQTDHPLLFDAIEHSEISFALTVLCLGSEMRIRKKILNDGQTSHFIGLAKNIIRDHFADKNDLIKLFLKLFELASRQENINYVQELIAELETQYKKNNVERFELGIAWNILVNYAIEKSNQDCKGQWSSVLLDLYKKGLENKWIFDHSELDTTKFINIALAGAMAGELDWTGHFINKFQPKLEENGDGNFVQLCLAYLFYHRGNKNNKIGNFNAALSIIKKLSGKGELFDLRLRSLELRIYYDSAKENSFTVQFMLSKSKNFKNYITRHSKTLSKAKRDFYLNFIIYYEMIVEYMLAFKKEKINKKELIKKIKNEPLLASKCWMLEKMAES